MPTTSQIPVRVPRTGASLRIVTAIVSVGRRQRKAGFPPTEPTKICVEEDSVLIEHGTPSRLLSPPQPFRFVGEAAKEVLHYRQCESVKFSPHDSIIEVAAKLSKLFEPHATARARRLTIALAHRVEEDMEILPGFSAAVVAAACTKLAAATLEIRPPLLAKHVLQSLEILPDAVRIACNHLWLQLGKLEAVILSGEGDPAMVPLPRAANGELDRATYRKGIGLPVRCPRRRKLRPRWGDSGRSKGKGKGSLLRHVTFPPETAEEFREAADVGGGPGGERRFPEGVRKDRRVFEESGLRWVGWLCARAMRTLVSPI